MRRLLLISLAAVLIAGPGSLGSLAQVQTPRKGGAIDVATIGEPPTLDPSVSTTDITGMIALHYFETLYTFGRGGSLVPLLADRMPSVSTDGLTYDIPLRTGVRFHDGGVMQPADVVASLKRWMEQAVRGRQAAGFIASLEPVGGAAIRIVLKQPYAPLLGLLSLPTSAAIILPAARTTPQLAELIGTGPFRFLERQPDRFVRVARFDDYAARSDEPNGYGGRRVAHLDEIRFVPVPNASTRVEGSLSGQYAYADSLPVESFGALRGQARTEPVVLKPFGWPVLNLNTRQGALTDVRVRRAVQLALKEGDMLEAAFGDAAFFSTDASLYPEGFVWHVPAGDVPYDRGDVAAARSLAREGGYTGQPIRILTTQQFEFHFRMAQVAVEYLRQAGFTVDLQVSDWATLTQRRAEPALWEAFFTHSPFLPEPALSGYFNSNSPGWWVEADRNPAMLAFNRESDPAKRVALFADVQKLVFDQVPMIKLGNFNALSAKSPKLRGFEPASWPVFWNTWLAE